MIEKPLHKWADHLESCIEQHNITIIDRVCVLAQTASTQDAATRMAAGRPGLLVLAAHQSAGRGRLGRQWNDDPSHSLAMTIALNPRQHNASFLALAAGVAVAEACAQPLDFDTIGLKWPNDVVDRRSKRKLAGVLVEASGPLALVGVGINVSHSREQLDQAKLNDATSLNELGARLQRLDIAVGVLQAMQDTFRLPEADLLSRWRARDVVTGTEQVFTHDGKRYEGIVESIDPTLTLVVRTREGIKRLPALTTSLKSEERSAG